MNENRLRNRISRFILISNVILYVSTFIYYILKGFDGEELSVIIALLSPVTAVYLAAMFKYAADTRHKEEPLDDRKVSKLYVMITNWSIPLHFGIIFLTISMKALFNFITFEQLKLIFAGTESLFGAYVGIIVASLYKVEVHDNKK